MLQRTTERCSAREPEEHLHERGVAGDINNSAGRQVAEANTEHLN